MGWIFWLMSWMDLMRRVIMVVGRVCCLMGIIVYIYVIWVGIVLCLRCIGEDRVMIVWWDLEVCID